MTVKDCGTPGTSATTTGEVTAIKPDPMLLIARTRNVYVNPVVSPGRVMDKAVELA